MSIGGCECEGLKTAWLGILLQAVDVRTPPMRTQGVHAGCGEADVGVISIRFCWLDFWLF